MEGFLIVLWRVCVCVPQIYLEAKGQLSPSNIGSEDTTQGIRFE